MGEDSALTGYCIRCGARLEIKTTWNGHATVHYTLVSPSSEGGRLAPSTHCPGCGEWLSESTIAPDASDCQRG